MDLVSTVGGVRSGEPVAAATYAGPVDPRVDLELALLVSGGITTLEAIRAATQVSARCLGVDHEPGTLGVRKRADLLQIRGDPSEDIRALSEIEWVILEDGYTGGTRSRRRRL